MEIRPLTQGDQAVVEAWVESDADHKISASDVYAPGHETFVFEDSEGPVFLMRFSRVLRIDISFGMDKKRTARMLLEALPAVVAQAKASGYTEILFQSVSPRLIRYCERRMGFKPCPDQFTLHI